MITIYFNNKPIYLKANSEEEIKKNHFPINSVNVKDYLEKLENNEMTSVAFYGKTIDQVYKKIKDSLSFIEAAGGVVMNSKNEYLFIYRNDVWDLPKGKIEENEDTATAALREVREECGIEILEFKEYLCRTYHIYKHKNHFVLKETYWYTMFTDQAKFTPQLEEGITEVVWIAGHKLDSILAHSYANIKMLLTTLKTD